MRTILTADLFCGAGGTSTGLARACRALGVRLDLVAVNHWPVAVETHAANHPAARHLCADVETLDPRKAVPGGKLDLLIASPECQHHSRARGGKPVSDQKRASAFHVLHWAEALAVSAILIENVKEFAEWGPTRDGRPLASKKGEMYRAFLQQLRAMNYRVEDRVLNAADYGDPTTRERLFILAGRGTRRISWPEPTHSARPDLFGSKPWRAAREIIDWTIPGKSIFERTRPLAPATMRRILAGLERFGGKELQPFLVVLRRNATARSLDAPTPAVVASGTHLALAEPFVLHLTHGRDRGRVRSANEPLPTITGANRGELGLIEPFVLSQASGGAPRSTGKPLPTLAAKGAVSLIESYLVPFYGENAGQAPRVHSVDDPVPTIPATGGGKFGIVHPMLVPYYRTGVAVPVTEPVPTVTTNDRFGIVMPVVDGKALDIRFRMLQPHELAAAMGFPQEYVFAGNRGDQVRQVGNAVCVNLAAALCVAALRPFVAGRTERARRRVVA